MERELFRFDERSYRPRRRTNYFLWAIAILLLIGFAFAAWLGSYYVFGQPERPDSYRILQKLHKIEPPRRFELTAAPKGEFLTAKQIFDRYGAMRPAELTEANAELTRNFIRNYQQTRGLVPYVIGRYDIMEARELTSHDVFTSGMVALTRATDRGELFMEHLYPGDPSDVELMKKTLVVGLQIKLERTHDLSAIIRAERTSDGRLLITAVPLLYGSYTVTHGTETFSLEPPNDLNLAAGWPIFKEGERRKAELHYMAERPSLAAAQNATLPVPGITQTGPTPPADNQLIRVEQALPPEGPKVATTKNTGRASSTPASKKTAKNEKPKPSATPITVAKLETTPAVSAPPARGSATPTVRAAEPVANESPGAASPHPPTVLPALPLTASDENALASTAGGGSWRTFEPGKMPAGRLINPSELEEIADRGMSGERYYLRGQFVVNFVDANRAVLRPKAKLRDKVFPFGGKSTRIIVEYPNGFSPPSPGETVNRDQARPYEITEVRKQSDGQINVFVREIMQ